ncbi:MAG: zinc-dependent dehydrogenase [Bryobacteraceae bacterium]
MRAAVYRGAGVVNVEEVDVPGIGPGELLVRVEACGICHTDLKKIEYGLLPPPRIYGHETAGEVVEAGAGVAAFRPGDRVVVFHHIPCGKCFYCDRKLFAQCSVYRKVGVTAGFEPAGGGFAEYVRVMDWIVARGVEKIPAGVSMDRACFVEPVNTCLKGLERLDPIDGDVVLVLGQGPIGLLFTRLAALRGARVAATDPVESRRVLSRRFGAELVLDPDAGVEDAIRAITGGRGADYVIVAASAPALVDEALRCSRPGSRILLFAQTSSTERIEVSGADICTNERVLLGSYSASVDLQKESADLVFSGRVPVEDLISHRLPLENIRDGFDLALHPNGKSLKIIVQPQRWPS